MIAYVKGTLTSKTPSSAVVDVSGIGYDIAISLHTFYSLPELGQEVLIYTYTHVREDVLQLYGFKTLEEKKAFLDLIAINGVGPKLALTILSGIAPDELARAVYEHNVGRLQKIPGVGKKTAERILLEMKHRLKPPEMQSFSDVVEMEETSPYGIAFAALIQLGYKSQEAERALATARKKVGDTASVEDLLKASLRVMAG
ncbi:MAG: Holliday junction branch migration protein RuvA [Thermodesulforhabdaceae bacterium]